MPPVASLIRLLVDPTDADAFDRAFGAPEPLGLREGVLPHPDDQPFLLKEVVCNDLADLGPDALEAINRFGVLVSLPRGRTPRRNRYPSRSPGPTGAAGARPARSAAGGEESD